MKYSLREWIVEGKHGERRMRYKVCRMKCGNNVELCG